MLAGGSQPRGTKENNHQEGDMVHYVKIKVTKPDYVMFWKTVFISPSIQKKALIF